MKKRLNRSYPYLYVVFKNANNDHLSVLRSKDKEGDKEVVSKVFQETWASADDRSHSIVMTLHHHIVSWNP
ncbi:DinI-like family protein [Pantoea sp. At-9b]|uniref:DinI-like family protein n=1 Tax=unclassified Pantoea TaxID=2630326 RepID=UPI0009005613